MHILARLPLLLLCATITAADAPTGDTELRLRLALQLAKESGERGDPALVQRIEREGPGIIAKDRVGDAAAVAAGLSPIEAAVGIDPGGWSMGGLPLFHPRAAWRERQEAVAQALDAAVRGGDAVAIAAAVTAERELLGDQAGIPDGRKAGVRAEPADPDGAWLLATWRALLAHQGRACDTVRAGTPLPGMPVRFYGRLLTSVCALRVLPGMDPAAVSDLDAIGDGCAAILVSLQRPDGNWPFPDMRGSHVRFGEMIEREIEAGAEVRDGWVYAASGSGRGGDQFDVGLAGSALLVAGNVRNRPAWTAAGLRAATWAKAQPCRGNWNYNAFSVSLLAEAARATGDAAWAEAAWTKASIGVLPGQLPSGRWQDPHNARTVYHRVLTRGCLDLAAVLPTGHPGRNLARDAAVRAVAALVAEFAKAGITVCAIGELADWRRLAGPSPELDEALARSVGALVAGHFHEPEHLGAAVGWILRPRP